MSERRPEVGDDIVYVAMGGFKYAAKVVYVWDGRIINAVSFGDGVNDREPTRMRTSVDRDDSGERGNTWHFRATVAVYGDVGEAPAKKEQAS